VGRRGAVVGVGVGEELPAEAAAGAAGARPQGVDLALKEGDGGLADALALGGGMLGSVPRRC
jgi:hypothetical protein